MSRTAFPRFSIPGALNVTEDLPAVPARTEYPTFRISLAGEITAGRSVMISGLCLDPPRLEHTAAALSRLQSRTSYPTYLIPGVTSETEPAARQIPLVVVDEQKSFAK